MPVRVILAVAFFNTLLSLHNIWPTPWIRLAPELSVELFAILLIAAVTLEINQKFARILVGCLTTAFVVLAIGRYADVTAPALFGRPINLYWDARHVPNVALMLIEVTPFWRIFLGVTAALAFIGGFLFAIRYAVKTIILGFYDSRLRRTAGAASFLILALFGLGMSSDDIHTEGWFALPVAPVYAHQADFVVEAQTRKRDDAPKPLAKSDMARIKGRDVFLIFFESYGATAFDDRDGDGPFSEIEALDAFLAGSKWDAVSTMVESPTFAGASWLAHSSLLSGRWLDNQGDYQFFLTNPYETLVDRFRSIGHRAIALAPGLKQAWPEGRSYGFDAILDANSLNYNGPAFGWWTIPDQFSLATFLDRELAPSRKKPVFLFFPTIMSHMPFGPTPPYQPDWNAVLGDEPFAGVNVDAALALLPEFDALRPAYMRTIRHNLRLLRGFLETRVPPDALVIVAGDHQPGAVVSGKNATWDAPVHVFSRDAQLLSSLKEAGFAAGMDPRKAAFGRMNKVNKALLEAMDSGILKNAARR
jgi:hypothetical protein